MHSHLAHLTTRFTNAQVTVTGKDGKTQTVNLPAGASFWSEADKDTAMNNSESAHFRSKIIDLLIKNTIEASSNRGLFFILKYLTQKLQRTHDVTQVLDFRVARTRFKPSPPLADSKIF